MTRSFPIVWGQLRNEISKARRVGHLDRPVAAANMAAPLKSLERGIDLGCDRDWSTPPNQTFRQFGEDVCPRWRRAESAKADLAMVTGTASWVGTKRDSAAHFLSPCVCRPVWRGVELNLSLIIDDFRLIVTRHAKRSAFARPLGTHRPARAADLAAHGRGAGRRGDYRLRLYGALDSAASRGSRGQGCRLGGGRNRLWRRGAQRRPGQRRHVARARRDRERGSVRIMASGS